MPAPTTKAERAQLIEQRARRVVDAFERVAEYKTAHDRVGDKPYHEAKRQFVASLVEFGREVAMAAVAARGK